MERRHEQLLTSRLEQAAAEGCAHITTPELHLWYGVKKLAAGTWRDLASRWDEAVQTVQQHQPNFSDPGQLACVSGRGGIFVFGEKRVERVKPAA
jgi:hypothetical protein